MHRTLGFNLKEVKYLMNVNGIRRVLITGSLLCALTGLISLQMAFAHSPRVETASEARPSTASSIQLQTSLTVEGLLSILHIDPAPDSGLAYQQVVRLFTDDGQTYILEMNANRVLPYQGQRVIVTGRMLATPADSTSIPTITVDMLIPQSTPTYAADDWAWALVPTSGTITYINLLCRFADSPPEPPQPPAYFDGLFGSEFPGINHYYQTISFGAVNLDGTTTTDQWFTLPEDMGYYRSLISFTVVEGLLYLAQDCVTAADDLVDFSPYDGINFIFDRPVAPFAFGTPDEFANLDGEARTWRMTWNPPFSWENVSIIAHEVGHTLSLPHSSGIKSEDRSDFWPYNSFWDNMSGGGDNAKLIDADYGRVGPGTIGYYAHGVGWIPEARVVQVADGESATVELERVVNPASEENPQLIILPVNNSEREFYTVELRQEVSYDEAIPMHGVVIHHVITDRDDDALARVVDADDGNTDVNDEGGAWRPGETFIEPTHNITVQVQASDTSSYTVYVSNDAVAEPIARANLLDGETVKSAGDYVSRPQWNHVTTAQWYHVYIATADYADVIVDEWYREGDVCKDGVCTLPDSIWIPENGEYVWWMGYWNDGLGERYIETYNDTTFTVDMAQPEGLEVLSPDVDGALDRENITLSWNANPDALWYQVWFGPDDYETSMVNRWFAAEEICSAGVCTLPDSYTLDDRAYELWVELWGPGGYTEWFKALEIPAAS